jgi:hypothetical protein
MVLVDTIIDMKRLPGFGSDLDGPHRGQTLPSNKAYRDWAARRCFERQVAMMEELPNAPLDAKCEVRIGFSTIEVVRGDPNGSNNWRLRENRNACCHQQNAPADRRDEACHGLPFFRRHDFVKAD